MKIPYQIRIEPEQLEQLRNLAKENGTSVNHEIRQAIRKELKKQLYKNKSLNIFVLTNNCIRFVPVNN